MNRKKFKGAMYWNEMTIKEVSAKLGLHESSLYLKLSTGSFTLEELQKLKAMWQLTDQQFKEIFFDEEVS